MSISEALLLMESYVTQRMDIATMLVSLREADEKNRAALRAVWHQSEAQGLALTSMVMDSSFEEGVADLLKVNEKKIATALVVTAALRQ